MIDREPPDPRVIWLTGIDGWEHAISDDEAARGMGTGDGIYESLCRRQVVAAPLIAPPGRRCAACARAMEPEGTATERQERRRAVTLRHPFSERLSRWRGKPPGLG